MSSSISAEKLAALKAKLAVINPTQEQQQKEQVLSKTEELNAELNILELQSKITRLSDALTSAHPSMPLLLREIHKTLREQPDNVTLLSDVELGTIFQALMKQTQTTISVKVLANKKKSVKSITIDDL